jgi:hypothetical protein
LALETSSLTLKSFDVTGNTPGYVFRQSKWPKSSPTPEEFFADRSENSDTTSLY